MDELIIFLLSGCIGFVFGYAMNCIFSVAKDANEQVRKLEEKITKKKKDRQ